MVLRDEENRVATRTFFVNEARGVKQPTAAWRALRRREPTCGQAVLWGWELVRDVAPGDEVVTTYEEDASGMPETRRDERSGTADAAASIGGVPRNLRGCGYLVATAPRRARAPSTARPAIEDRHLQIAVRESCARSRRRRRPRGRDLETGRAMQGDAGRRAGTRSPLATARRRRGARTTRARRGAEPAAAPVPAAAPPTPRRPRPRRGRRRRPADAAALPLVGQ